MSSKRSGGCIASINLTASEESQLQNNRSDALSTCSSHEFPETLCTVFFLHCERAALAKALSVHGQNSWEFWLFLLAFLGLAWLGWSGEFPVSSFCRASLDIVICCNQHSCKQSSGARDGRVHNVASSPVAPEVTECSLLLHLHALLTPTTESSLVIHVQQAVRGVHCVYQFDCKRRIITSKLSK